MKIPNQKIFPLILILFVVLNKPLSGQVNFTSDITEGCSPLLVQFNNLSSIKDTNGTYLWRFGDGTTSAVENPQYIYDQPGFYTVTFIVTDNNSLFTDSLVRVNLIEVYNNPVAVLTTGSHLYSCSPLTVEFKDSSVQGSAPVSSWLWDFGNGDFSSDQHPSSVYTTTDDYTTSLEVVDTNGCSDDTSVVFHIDPTSPIPAVNFTTAKRFGCDTPYTVKFQDNTTGKQPFSYVWVFGDGDSAFTQNPVHTYQDTGKYTVSIYVTDSVNCTRSNGVGEYIKVRVLKSGFIDSTSLCTPTTYRFFDASSSQTNQWLWIFGDGDSSTSQDPTHTFPGAGSYNVQLIATDKSYACSDTSNKIINIVQPLLSRFDTSTIKGCGVPFSVSFKDSSINAVSWLWNFGDGNTSTQQDPSHTYNSAGAFNVSLTITDSNSCPNTFTVNKKVIIENMTADFKTDTNKFCSPAIIFSDKSTPSPTAWKWNMGDGDSSNQKNFSHTYKNGGNYNVQLIAFGKYCSDTVSKSITANPPSVYANFSADTTYGCNFPFTVKFTDSSLNAQEYQWDFGDGSFATSASPTHTYNKSGIFNVSLKITAANGCIDRKEKTELIIVGPKAGNFTYSFDCKDPFNIQFSDELNNAVSSLWNFGDGNSSTLQNPDHTYTDTGSYVVTLQITDSATACVYNLSDTLIIREIATAFSADSTVKCHGNASVFTNNTQGATTYFWDFGDGNTSTDPNPTHQYQQPGVYPVTLIASNDNCADTLKKNNYITIDAPKAKFGFIIDCSNPGTVNFIDSSINAHTWQWDFGDGNTSTDTFPTHTYSAEGTYIVTLQTFNTGSGCAHLFKDTITVTILQADFTIDTNTICYNDSARFFDASNYADAWQWDFGDGNISTEQNPVHHFENPGTYSVRLITTVNKTCKDTTLKADTIRVLAPKAAFSFNKSCTNSLEVAFTDNATGASTWFWNFGDGNTSTSRNPVHNYAAPDTFVVQLTTTNTSNGCIDRYSDTIVVTSIKADFSIADPVLCYGNQVEFYDSSEYASSWRWDFGDGNFSTEQHPLHEYEDPGNYSIKLTVTDIYGCTDTLTRNDHVEIQPPKAGFDSYHDCANYFTATFNDSSINATSWFWDFGDGNSSVLQNPVHDYVSTGSYNVKLTTSNAASGCIHSFSKTVYITVPKADFNVADTVVCAKYRIPFSDRSDFPNQWKWDFGNGDSSISQNPAYIYDSAGIYSIKLEITDINGCKDSLSKSDHITVNELPIAIFGVDSTDGCAPFTVQFTDSSTSDVALTNWDWHFGDGTSAQQNPSHTYNQPGAYNVRLTVTNSNSCKHSILKSRLIKPTFPISAFDVLSAAICKGTSPVFRNFSSGANLKYVWNLGDGTIDSSNTPVHVYDTVKQYTVKLFAIDSNGCIDSLVKQNYISVQAPTANFETKNTPYADCPDLLVEFRDSSASAFNSSAQWFWDFGDGTGTSTLRNPGHIYRKSGTFDVRLVVISSGGCIDTLIKEDLVVVDGPIANFDFNPKQGCKPMETTFIVSDKKGVENFFIDYRDGSTFEKGDTLTHTYNQTGNFVPLLWLRDSVGCSYFLRSSDTAKIINVKANLSVVDNLLGCAPLTVNFKDTSTNANTYLWNFGDSTTSTNKNPDHVYQNPGRYSVELIVSNSNNGCADTIQKNKLITVFGIDAAMTINQTEPCVPFNATFSDASTSDGNITSWFWDFGNNDTTSMQTPSSKFFNNENDSVYNISLTVQDDNTCSDQLDTIFVVNTKPDVAFQADTSKICPGGQVAFTNLSDPLNGSIFLWDFGDTTSTGESPDISFSIPGYKNVRLSVTTPAGCDSSLAIDSLILVHNYVLAEAGKSFVIKLGEKARLQASGGVTYAWSPTEGLNDPAIANPDASPEKTSIYYVTVTDSNFCKGVDSVTVVILGPDAPLIFIPDAFTPNNDGNNDLLRVINYDMRELVAFKVFNRWGQEVFSTNNFNEGWDGTYNDVPQEIGTYVYYVEGITNGGEKIFKKGDIALIR